MHCLYLNTARRTDRREHMEREIRRVGWTAERLDGETPEPLGFVNGKLRGNWMGHTQMIRRAADRDDLLILEDDVDILDAEKIQDYLADMRKETWDCIYFYGSSRLKRLKSVLNFHGYAVNPKFANTFADKLDARREEIEHNGFEDYKQCSIDIFVADVLQYVHAFWGTEPLIVQNRARFGSDMRPNK